jgi:hypothetical protein
VSTLYDISENLLALDALLWDSEGEITPEIEAWMAEYGGELIAKVDRTGAYIRELESIADACRAEEERLRKRRTVQENKVRSIKQLLDQIMVRLDRSKLVGETFTIARQKNGGVRKLELNPDAVDLLPEFFWKVERRVDTDRVRESMDEVMLVDGVEVARLAEPTYSVRVK